jgi:arylformamidase
MNELDESKTRPIGRRGFLGTATGALLAGMTGATKAEDKPESAARRNGPKLWLDMDQAELDDAYNQIKYAPNLPQVMKRYASNSDAMRARRGEPQRVTYGPTAIETMEIYATKKANAPINIFIHGGAWRQRPARDYAFPAELFNDAGAHYLLPDFVAVDEPGGGLPAMADQVRRAIVWAARNAKSFSGDPSKLYITGFSSGSHLAGVALITDWQREFGLERDLVKGAVLSSGMYDLKPVRLSARSKYVPFTDEIEADQSIQRHIERVVTPLVLAHGTYETPEFQRQSRDFAAELRRAQKPVELLVGQNYNHFEMMETFASPYALLGRAALTQMGLRFPA